MDMKELFKFALWLFKIFLDKLIKAINRINNTNNVVTESVAVFWECSELETPLKEVTTQNSGFNFDHT